MECGEKYIAARSVTGSLVAGISVEDQMVQSCPEAGPVSRNAPEGERIVRNTTAGRQAEAVARSHVVRSMRVRGDRLAPSDSALNYV